MGEILFCFLKNLQKAPWSEKWSISAIWPIGKRSSSSRAMAWWVISSQMTAWGGLSHHLLDNPGEVLGRDTEGIGIELDVVLLGKVFRHEGHEVERDEIAFAHIRRYVAVILLMGEHAVAQFEAETFEVDTGQFAAVVVGCIGQRLVQEVEWTFEPGRFGFGEMPDAYVGVFERVVQGAGTQVFERFAGKLERDQEAPPPQFLTD